MRILLVTLEPPVPSTSGHRLHLWALLRALAADQHRVTLICFSSSEETVWEESLGPLCESVEMVRDHPRQYLNRIVGLFSHRPYGALRYASEPLRRALGRLLESSAFDAIICDEIYPVANLPEGCRVPVVVDTQHVAHILLRRYAEVPGNPFLRLYAWTEARKMLSWEAAVCRRVAAVGVCSELEGAVFQQLCPGVRVVSIPNAIDVDQYRPAPQAEGARVLYCGAMDWYPNQDAIRFFLSDIFPGIQAQMPDVRFVAAGRNPPESFQKRFASLSAVEFTGAVPDMLPEFARAAVFVVPLRIAGGTRVKILEAAAMAKPIVSTRVGAEGLDFVDGKEILLADEPKAFAQAVAGLLGDASRRRALGQAARRRVEESYSLPVLRMAVRAALAELPEGSLVVQR